MNLPTSLPSEVGIRSSFMNEPIVYDAEGVSNQELLQLYQEMLFARSIEEKMLILLRQGRISKWFSGIGQEAVSVGLTLALHPADYILPLHRNLGVFTARKMPFGKLFAQWQGKEDGFSKARERSFHFGSNQHHVVGMISHLGPQLTLANGIALAELLQETGKISATFTGDGGASEGDFHEALNVAAVWDLPVIFVVENNGYGLSTPASEQFRCAQFIDKGIGYGMQAVQVDGNNILEVYKTVKNLAASMRINPRPVLLECLTFRMRGHEEASGTKYVPKELFDIWGKKDPLTNFERFLIGKGILTSDNQKLMQESIKQTIEEGLQYAFELPDPTPNITKEIADVYAPYEPIEVAPSNVIKEMRFCDAINQALSIAMDQHKQLVLMGQDIAQYGGVFKITEGLMEKFGKDRVRNTPLCESAIIGAALGLSIRKQKAMVEMQFADFVTCGFNQIVNNLAKMYYRWGQNADVVIRMPTGAGVGAGPFHSQSNEAWFFHVPGLKIVYPTTPADAKGLLLAAIDDPNPYLFFEHKVMYRSVSGEVPEGYYTIPIGKGVYRRRGNQATVIAYGMAVLWVEKLLNSNPQLDVELIDLRTILPWDKDIVLESVKKTGKVLIAHEDNLTGGIGGEIAAWIAENAFNFLDAPVMRHGALDTPIPFAISLEQQYLGEDRLKQKLFLLLNF